VLVLLLFIVFGFVLAKLARFAEHVMRTRGGWYGLAALLPFLSAIGVMVYLFTLAL